MCSAHAYRPFVPPDAACMYCPSSQFIAGFANMRARNYAIPEVDKLQVSSTMGRYHGVVPFVVQGRLRDVLPA